MPITLFSQRKNSSLNEFISTVKKDGLAKQSKFAAIINQPPCLSNSEFDYKFMTLFCNSGQIPGITISTAQTKTYGETREMPYDRLFDNTTLTFYVDTKFKVKDFFDQWIYSIIDPNTRNLNYYDNYTTTIMLKQYDQNEKERYITYLYEAYPKMVSPLITDYSSQEIQQLQVSINYKYWIAVPVLQEDPDLAGTNPLDQFAAKAFQVLDKFNPYLSSNLSGIYNNASQYFNKFTDFQRNLNFQFNGLGIF